MHWSNSMAFLFVLVIVFALGMFYVFYRLNLIQKKQLQRLKLESERKYLELADLLPQIVFEADADGKILFINKNGLDALGLSRIDIINGIQITDLVVDSERSSFIEDFLYIREGGQNRGQEYLMRPKNSRNRTIPMMLYMTQITSETNIIGVRGILVDITERKLVEQKLLGAIIETEDKERKRFSEDLHDGLGPLLSTIRLYFNQLQLREISDEEREQLLRSTYDLLDEAISTTKSIANNILPGSISDHGLIPALRIFFNRVESTGVLHVDMDSNLVRRLSGNTENTIYRILIELVNNTIKHSGATIISFKLIDFQDHIIIEYSDNGIGFDVSIEHNGLGLQNIRNRCKSIGASIDFSSNMQKGFGVKIEVNI